jgi:hypothetical protein
LAAISFQSAVWSLKPEGLLVQKKSFAGGGKPSEHRQFPDASSWFS